MLHAKKMALVEPKLLEALNSTPKTQDPVVTKMSDLDREMRIALEKPGDVAQKVQAYNQILQRFLVHQQTHERTPIQVQLKSPPPEDNVDTVEEDVIASLPKSYQSKGQYLLTRLRNDPHVQWNNRGEIILDGKMVSGSNLADLVNDILRNRKNAPDPVGWSEFANHLHKMNLPQEFIGHKARMRFRRPPGEPWSPGELYINRGRERMTPPHTWSPQEPSTFQTTPVISRSRRKSQAPDKWTPDIN
jgi:hypothetical protein